MHCLAECTVNLTTSPPTKIRFEQYYPSQTSPSYLFSFITYPKFVFKMNLLVEEGKEVTILSYFYHCPEKNWYI